MQNGGGCSRLPRKTKVGVAKCHACLPRETKIDVAKCKPRVPRETKVDVAKCHACHTKYLGITGDKARPSVPKCATRATPMP